VKGYISEARVSSAPELTAVQMSMNELLLPVFKGNEGEVESVQHSWPTSVEAGRSTLSSHPTAPAIIAMGVAPKRTVRKEMLESKAAFAPRK
jgi:hypothetical protein